MFHNTTAHYNAYFIANEKITEIENTIAQGYQWNYNKVLPIFPQFDSTDAAGFTQLTEDIVEKASIAIQRHPNSKWVDNSYILVGKARFYGLDFPNAIETFKYVNTNGEGDDERHEALVSLMRTFIEADELNNAEAVSDFLKREKLNKSNLKNLYLNRGYLYQRREDFSNMVSNLNRAEPLLAAKDEPARIYFVIGQVYQQLGFESEAYNNYNQCLKHNPPYELSFYAKLNMAQVTQLANPGDLKKVRKYFKGLLTDEKNKEYQDKIYYEMGNFEMKQGNLSEAIDFYKESVRASINNNRQKAYSYLRLSEIYYDTLSDYRLSKLYYDSTLLNMPKDEDIYQEIEERQAILAEFVKQIDIIETNDSLLYLASLDTSSLNSLLDDYILAQQEQEERRKKKEKERRERSSNFSVFDQNQGNLISAVSNDATWYFYNSAAVSQGTSEFNRKWGNRILEDNWRRSSKEQSIIASNVPEETKTSAKDETTDDDGEASAGLTRESLIATIPYGEDQQATLLAEVEEALYQLGTIYYFQLKEKESSAETFEQLLLRFPETAYAPEVLYELYLLYEDLGDPTNKDRNKNILLDRFPESIYAKLILNPNYREESQAISSQLKKVYEKSYKLYQQGEYAKALSAVNASLDVHPDNDFSDNLELLKILIIGKTSDTYRYH
ncbi:MAG: methyltransferase, partial [Bacteroidota bacterium]